MSNLSLFLKGNKKQKSNVFYAATKSLCDENGKPLQWELRPISTRENDEIRDECTVEVQVTGKPNLYRPKVNSALYAAKMVVASIVYPDLDDAELQDSYGVKKPEDLIKEMIDDPGEYNDLIAFVQNLNGFTAMDDKVAEAKN